MAPLRRQGILHEIATTRGSEDQLTCLRRRPLCHDWKLQDLALQAKKIEEYSKWGGLKVNNKKCASTSMLYAKCKQDPSNRVLN